MELLRRLLEDFLLLARDRDFPSISAAARFPRARPKAPICALPRSFTSPEKPNLSQVLGFLEVLPPIWQLLSGIYCSGLLFPCHSEIQVTFSLASFPMQAPQCHLHYRDEHTGASCRPSFVIFENFCRTRTSLGVPRRLFSLSHALLRREKR